MRSALPRALITGFGPFPGVPANATAEAAATLHGQDVAGFRLTGAVLDVTWAGAWPALAAAALACAPRALIMLGVAPRQAPALERFAHNRAAARPDAVGALPPAAHLDPSGPPRLESTFPWAEFVWPVTLPCGLPLGVSEDAGDYLCNATIYRALRHLVGVRWRGFLHVPGAPPGGHAAAVTLAVEAACAVLSRLNGGSLA